MKRSTGFVLCLMLVAAAALAAETPNLSGTWKENLEKSTKSNVTSYVNKIETSGDTMKLTTTTNGPRGERTFTRSYVIGKETTSKMPDGDDVTTSANWEGNALVIVSTIKEPNGAVQSKETWTVSADGKTLTKQRHSHGPRGDRDETFVLERQ
ncbi:MAG TPA: hypothetical protein VKH35_05440 [Thermoanaerobaculia bacterium]|jgi:hypothetical protein|nr:hypothetical protein [Thermoanaerobaculia bacterium]